MSLICSDNVVVKGSKKLFQRSTVLKTMLECVGERLEVIPLCVIDSATLAMILSRS